MDDLFHRDPDGSVRFLNGLMYAGFIHGSVSMALMTVTLYYTQGSQVSCDMELRRWLWLQLGLQSLQFVSRWQLFRSLPANCPPTADINRQQAQQITNELSELVKSKKWTINRLFGLLALCCFFLGIWWLTQARSYRCEHTPSLWTVCALLLWLFCSRTAFVYMWFGYCFSGRGATVDFPGRFDKPGLAQSVLESIGVKQLTQAELEGRELACAICLSDFEAGEQVRKTQCGHQFHVACIDVWLRQCSSCPLCNQDVLSGKSRYHDE